MAETRVFLEAWQRILLGSSPWVAQEIEALREQCRSLCGRARLEDASGLSHHLGTCEQCFVSPVFDRARLSQRLRNVSELAWQLRQALEAEAHEAGVSDESASTPTPNTGPSPAPANSEAPPLPPAVSSLVGQAQGASEPMGFERDSEVPSRLDALLGLRAFGGVAKKPGPPRPRSAVPSVRPGEQTPSEVELPASLPPLDPIAADVGLSQALARDLDLRLERSRQAAAESEPKLSDPVVFDSANDAADSLATDSPLPFQHTVSRFSAVRSRPRWIVAGAVTAIVALALVIGMRLRRTGSDTRVSNAVSSLATPPREKAWLSAENQRLRQLLAEVHGRGGAESPELADAIDEEAGLLGQALSEPCATGSRACDVLERARGLLATPNGISSVRPHNPVGAPAPWLSGLKLPAIGVSDPARVREIVEVHTQQAVGRETFQGLLFQCGSFQDLFREALGQKGLPLDLMALAMAESGCVPDMESPTGARGLWRLMPVTARAYHLHVEPGVMDERLSPTKSTEVAALLLKDLQRKLGAWDLVIPSFEVGSFGFLATLEGAAPAVGTAGAADVGQLSPSIMAYVAKIQGFALILANLEYFRFELGRAPTPEATAVLEVPAGTRLGLLARAAASSTTRIRELNPDVIGDRVPELPGKSFFLRIPAERLPRSQAALTELLGAEDDHADQCVPHNFDWGRQRFSSAMASRCEHTRAAHSP